MGTVWGVQGQEEELDQSRKNPDAMQQLEVSGWEVGSQCPPLLRVGCNFLHGGPVPGGGWPWRLRGHLAGWEESPREMGRGLNQSHENGKIGMGLGTISQVADGVTSRYQTGFYQ